MKYTTATTARDGKVNFNISRKTCIQIIFYIQNI
jgi:hypothetical protein